MSDNHRAGATDAHIGENLRKFRQARGWSQETLAVALGISFQQVQKYERGRNRISCSRLYDAANALSIHPSAFFDGLNPPSPPPKEPTNAAPSAGEEAIAVAYLLARLDTEDRRRVLALVRSPKLKKTLP